MNVVMWSRLDYNLVAKGWGEGTLVLEGVCHQHKDLCSCPDTAQVSHPPATSALHLRAQSPLAGTPVLHCLELALENGTPWQPVTDDI